MLIISLRLSFIIIIFNATKLKDCENSIISLHIPEFKHSGRDIWECRFRHLGSSFRGQNLEHIWKNSYLLDWLGDWGWNFVYIQQIYQK